ncbi:hypothetical protein GE061_011299 [Apolygus lucorum]|uniref:Uncharacterized protein n=1 Tax=Apolygus lucorum TaxID=248454 RepID=A0A6A4KAC0_APOLU|nr:hypothetical protein GE061_011299 [Apolygus lucorum]
MDVVWCVVIVMLLIVTVSYVTRSSGVVDIRRTGSWAVVTGATDGIGKSFSHELAKLGMNVVLVSRNMVKLQTCAAVIEESYGVATAIVQADFTSLDKKMYARIREELADLDVGVLVNNVGMNLIHPEYFHVLDERHDDTFQNFINCNITSTVNMTRFVLSGMVERRRGLIVNVSSVFSQIPAPFFGVYSATKSFVDKFTNDLALEYKTFGIHVHLLRTGFVATKLSDMKRILGFVPDPDTYGRSALRETARRRDCDGYFGHWLTRMGILAMWAVVPSLAESAWKLVMSKSRDKRISKCEKCLGEKSVPITASPW